MPLHQYDLEIIPTKLIKGWGLARLLAESNCKALNSNLICNGLVCIDNHDKKGELQIYPNYLQSEWYRDIISFLQTLQCPVGLDK